MLPPSDSGPHPVNILDPPLNSADIKALMFSAVIDEMTTVDKGGLDFNVVACSAGHIITELHSGAT